MRYAAAVSDYVQALMFTFEIFVDFDFHIVELDFDAVQKRVVVGGTGRDFIERVNHFDNTVENTLGQYKAKISGRRRQRGNNKPFFYTLSVLLLPLTRSPKR